MNAKPLPPIILTKAICSAFGTGHCWSARNPYYSGHYATKEKAATAAALTKRHIKEQRGGRLR